MTKNLTITQDVDGITTIVITPNDNPQPSGGMLKEDGNGKPKSFTLTEATTGGFVTLDNGLRLSLNLAKPITPAEQQKLRIAHGVVEEPGTIVLEDTPEEAEVVAEG